MGIVSGGLVLIALLVLWSQLLRQKATDQYQYASDLAEQQMNVQRSKRTTIEIIRDLEAQGIPYSSISIGSYDSINDPEVMDWRWRRARTATATACKEKENNAK